ncbi:helix-turn-helix domain-containing protein [Nocardia sp. GCM10030253]|uniref:helix-turn-helix domain-containing protein n=1 Tax=Nocardia sp. GCM10030253 TaxID=3273404 RepID=UPI003626A891
MIEQGRSWRLERNGNVVFAAVSAEFACYAESSGPVGGGHRHPAWQLMLSWDGEVTATDETGRITTGPGVLVPPGMRCAVTHPDGFTGLWIDPYGLAIAGRPGIQALDRAQVRRLLACTGGDLDPIQLRRIVRRTLGDAPAIDPRFSRALSLLDSNTDIEDLAVRVGLSARRLRQLSVETIGGPLTTLRRWHRLREAGLQLPFHSAAEVAAQTGFADQPHLIRTMVALCGRTPGSSDARMTLSAPAR